MSFLHDVLQFVFGPLVKRQPGSSHIPAPLPVRQKGAHRRETRQPLRQSTPHSHPAGLTVRQWQEALGLARRLIVARSSLPILSYCLLEPGKLTVTDLESSLTIDLPGRDTEPVCVPVGLLSKALRFVKEPIRLVKRDLDVVLNDTFTLSGMDPQEFPASPAGVTLESLGGPFPVPERWAALVPAMGLDATRSNLSGVCIDLAAGHCVSSDGHRLHAVQIPARAGEGQGIVPLTAAKLLAQLLTRGEVTGQLYRQCSPLTKAQEELLATESSDVTSATVRHQRETLEKELQRPTSALFCTPGVEFLTRLVESEFPDYHQVLQRPTKLCQVTLPMAPLLAAVKACLACAHKDRLSVSLTRLPAGVRIRLEATDNGSVERLIECRGWQPGRYVGLNARYLLQALECVQSDEVTLLIKDEASPVHPVDDALHVVISPLRISEPIEYQKAKKEGDIPAQPDETPTAAQAE
jgi:DNA polymerase III sliding clamp (beta) subunit (PCNA family)